MRESNLIYFIDVWDRVFDMINDVFVFSDVVLGLAMIISCFVVLCERHEWRGRKMDSHSICNVSHWPARSQSQSKLMAMHQKWKSNRSFVSSRAKFCCSVLYGLRWLLSIWSSLGSVLRWLLSVSEERSIGACSWQRLFLGRSLDCSCASVAYCLFT